MTGRALGAIEAVGRRPWFVDAVVLAGCAAIVLAAAIATPGADVVSFFGVEMPVVCGFRRLTGIGCPGCGLTRSFAFLAHGRLAEGFASHWFGPVVFAVVAGQVPYRVYRIVAGAVARTRAAG